MGGSSAATIAYTQGGPKTRKSVRRGEFKIPQSTHLVKDVLQAFLRQRRTLDVLDCAKLPREPFSLLRGDRSLLLPCQLLDDLAIVPQIYLRPNDQAGNSWTVVMDFREPFLFYVFEGRR